MRQPCLFSLFSVFIFCVYQQPQNMAINEIASQLFIVQSPHDSIVQHRISRVVHVVAHSTRYPRAVHVHWCLSPPNAKSSSAHSPGGDLDSGSRRCPHKLLLLKRCSQYCIERRSRYSSAIYGRNVFERSKKGNSCLQMNSQTEGMEHENRTE